MNKTYYVEKFPKHFNLRVKIGNLDLHVAFLTGIDLEDAELLADKLNLSPGEWNFSFEK